MALSRLRLPSQLLASRRKAFCLLKSRTLASVSGIPEISLLDERIPQITVNGLEPNSLVTLHLNMTNNLTLNYDSFNQFRASSSGVVDLENDSPLCKGYTRKEDKMKLNRCNFM